MAISRRGLQAALIVGLPVFCVALAVASSSRQQPAQRKANRSAQAERQPRPDDVVSIRANAGAIEETAVSSDRRGSEVASDTATTLTVDRVRQHAFFRKPPTVDQLESMMTVLTSKPDGFLFINNVGDSQWVSFSAFSFPRMPKRNTDSVSQVLISAWSGVENPRMSIAYSWPYAMVYIDAGLGSRLTREYASALLYDSIDARDLVTLKDNNDRAWNGFKNMVVPKDGQRGSNKK